MDGKRRWLAVVGGAALVLASARPALGLLIDMADHWSGSLVAALSARRIISGDEQGRFSPDASLTRAQLAKLLVTGLGHQEDAQLLSGYPSRFTDMPNWHWAKGYAESLAELSVVEGYPDGSFHPEDEVTRAQMAVILVRMAGDAEQARRMRFEATGYTDDAEIPDWARGYVHVARATGLMSGFEEGSFRPLQPVTRAEGSVTLFRLLQARGRMFHASGTLVRFDPATRQGVVRDDLGQERSFTMAVNGEYYRGGAPSAVSQIKTLDQVWIVLGPDGTGTFMDARFQDVLGLELRAERGTATVRMPDGTRTYTLQPGVLTFLNGQPSTLEKMNGAQLAYLILDRVTGQVRVLDAVTASVGGRLVGVAPAQSTIHVQTEGQIVTLRVDSRADLIRSGMKVSLTDLQIGDQVQIVVNGDGVATYVLAER